MTRTQIWNNGGGVDSTAMLIGMVKRFEPVHLILFSDTGGEKNHTYSYLHTFSDWLQQHGYPPIIQLLPRRKTLEQDCLDRNALPSIAYGFKTCSQRFKTQPQEVFLNNWKPAIDEWKAGAKVTKLIGYDADEAHRAKDFSDKKYTVRYPLIEWNWGRDEAIKAIKDAGLPVPGKSACFFCPSSKKAEILQLKLQYPQLAQRAIAMEENAELTTVKGLGRDFAWKDLIAFSEKQLDMFPESRIEIDCGCYDG